MISAYDLARDIAKELAQRCPDLEIQWDDGDAFASLDEEVVLPVIEKMIGDALKNGGIAP